ARMPAAQKLGGLLDPGSASSDCPAPMAISAQILGEDAGSSESAYAWLRLAASVLMGTIGSVGLWAYVVALPVVQADFGITRADASLPYTLTMLGFALGAAAIGGLVDRLGIVSPLIGCTLALGGGFVASGLAPSLPVFALANLLIGIGSSRALRPPPPRPSPWLAPPRATA